MNTEKTVTRKDVGGQNSNIIKRMLRHPLGMPISMMMLICIFPGIANCLLHEKEIKADGELLSSLVLIHGSIAGLFILALCVVYRWSRTSSYVKFCDRFYDESRNWSYAGLTVTVVLAIFAYLIQNALVVDSVEEVSQPFIIFPSVIPYASGMVIAWQVLFSLLFFVLYFRIDRSLEITYSINRWTAIPVSAFVLAPFGTALAELLGTVDDFLKPFAEVLLFGALLAATVSTFFFWAFISRVHAPQDTETRPSGHGKKLRKSLRKHLSKQWGMYQQLQRWRWDRRFPQRRERTVGMFA